MQFQSITFILFLVVVVLLGWWLPRRRQNLFLFIASVVFYGWVHPWFPALMLVSALTDYACSREMLRRPDRRRPMVWTSLIVNLGVLGTFKYLDFFVDNVHAVLATLGLDIGPGPLHLLLPAGISFYTFQTMSFTIDVSRGRLKTLPPLVDYLLFVSFFPQLVAGPIERAERLLRQLSAPRVFHAARWRDAVLLLCWGFFQKLVIADNVAVFADKVFALRDPTFPLLWAGVVAFSIQIYADFSAYSDIARGSAGLLGIDLMRNFNHPYTSQSPQEFWRRWHISLSQWFRDYVYLPLGGDRVSPARWGRNIVVVFGLSGLWHGASWNFLWWGLYWATLVVAQRLWRHLRGDGVPVASFAVGRMIGMYVLATIGWLLFRETDSTMLWRDLWLRPGDAPRLHWEAARFFILQTALYASPLLLHALWERRWPGDAWSSSSSSSSSSSMMTTGRLLVSAVAATLCLLGIAFLRADTRAPFIYFQF